MRKFGGRNERIHRLDNLCEIPLRWSVRLTCVQNEKQRPMKITSNQLIVGMTTHATEYERLANARAD